MPLKKAYTPKRPNFVSLGGTQVQRILPPSPGPVLVPTSQPTPPPPPGSFSSAFSNAFDV
jgi:hypothetical protein